MKARLTLTATGRTVAAVALTAVLAACGSAQGQPAAAASATGSGQVRHCTMASLQVVMDPNSIHAAAGATYLPVDFLNRSQSTCVLSGYPSVFGYLGSQSSAIKAAELPGASPRVLLGPGYTAHAWVRVRHVSGCGRPAGLGLRVFAPGSAGHAWINYAFASCARAGKAVLAVRPVQQGLANPGIFP